MSARLFNVLAVTVIVVISAMIVIGESRGAQKKADESTGIFHWPPPNANAGKHGLTDALAFFSTVYPNIFGDEIDGTGGGSGGRIRGERAVTNRAGGERTFWTTLAATFLPMFISQRDDDAIHTLPFNITDLLRMVGVDSDKIGTMVINAIVYIIEMVSNHFFGGTNTIEGRKLETPGSFLLFLFDKKVAEDFLKRVSDPELPNTVISNLQRSTGNDTVCIQQLICKMSPFWWGVNQSIRDLLPLGKKTPPDVQKLGWTSLLKKYVPSLKEFSFNSDLCETRFPGCVVMTHPRTAEWSRESLPVN